MSGLNLGKQYGRDIRRAALQRKRQLTDDHWGVTTCMAARVVLSQRGVGGVLTADALIKQSLVAPVGNIVRDGGVEFHFVKGVRSHTDHIQMVLLGETR